MAAINEKCFFKNRGTKWLKKPFFIVSQISVFFFFFWCNTPPPKNGIWVKSSAVMLVNNFFFFFFCNSEESLLWFLLVPNHKKSESRSCVMRILFCVRLVFCEKCYFLVFWLGLFLCLFTEKVSGLMAFQLSVRQVLWYN